MNQEPLVSRSLRNEDIFKNQDNLNNPNEPSMNGKLGGENYERDDNLDCKKESTDNDMKLRLKHCQLFSPNKGPTAFGHSGDEIVGRLLIPWGHYKVGAQNIRPWYTCGLS